MSYNDNANWKPESEGKHESKTLNTGPLFPYFKAKSKVYIQHICQCISPSMRKISCSEKTNQWVEPSKTICWTARLCPSPASLHWLEFGRLFSLWSIWFAWVLFAVKYFFAVTYKFLSDSIFFTKYVHQSFSLGAEAYLYSERVRPSWMWGESSSSDSRCQSVLLHVLAQFLAQHLRD